MSPLAIQREIIEECAKIDEAYKTMRMGIRANRQEIEELFSALDVDRRRSRLSLANREKFGISIGKRVLNTELVPNGNIPVYSANVTEPFGYTDKLLLTDFFAPAVLWGIDGDWMTSYVPEDRTFYPTDHCGVLRCIGLEVNPRYLAHLLEIEGQKMGFSRAYRTSIERIQGIMVSVPDIETQNEAMKKALALERNITDGEKRLANISEEKI